MSYTEAETQYIKMKFSERVSFYEVHERRIHIITGFYDFDFYRYDEDFNAHFGCVDLGLVLSKEYKFTDFKTFAANVDDFIEFIKDEIDEKIRFETNRLDGISNSFKKHVRI